MKNASFLSSTFAPNRILGFSPLCLFLAMLLSCTDMLHAQSRFGLLAGQNIGSFSLDPSDGVNITEKAGFTAGFFIDHILGNSPAAVHFTTMYVQKGGILDDSYDEIDIKLNYIEQQVLLKVGRNVFVEGGFSLAGLLSARGKAYGESGDIKEMFSGTDFGFVAGAGFRIGIVTIEARYSGSLVSALREDLGGEIFNRGIQLLAGFSIPMNR